MRKKITLGTLTIHPDHSGVSLNVNMKWPLATANGGTSPAIILGEEVAPQIAFMDVLCHSYL